MIADDQARRGSTRYHRRVGCCRGPITEPAVVRCKHSSGLFALRFSLAPLVTLFEMGCGRTPGSGRYHFLPRRSFSASASTRFSLALFARSLEPVAFTGSRLKRLQPLRVRDLHASENRLSSVERGTADPMTTAEIGGLRPSLSLAQDVDDLGFVELR